jgi:hypothetical protein
MGIVACLGQIIGNLGQDSLIDPEYDGCGDVDCGEEGVAVARAARGKKQRQVDHPQVLGGLRIGATRLETTTRCDMGGFDPSFPVATRRCAG